jgi:uncharacterized protein with von Willebrand factor type A (vWA) domain
MADIENLNKKLNEQVAAIDELKQHDDLDTYKTTFSAVESLCKDWKKLRTTAEQRVREHRRKSIDSEPGSKKKKEGKEKSEKKDKKEKKNKKDSDDEQD